MSVTTEYSLWLALICLLLAAAGSWFLYRNNKLDLSGKRGKYILWMLHAFRFLSLFIISFLLLGPLLKVILRNTEKPVLLFAVDQSASIVSTKDSAFYRTAFMKEMQELKQDLSDDYEVVWWNFGKEITHENTTAFDQKQTNIANVLSEARNTYNGQNLGAVVLVSDGIYNDGSNPLYETRNISSPVYTVALGDTNQRKDLLVKNVRHNQVVYSGNIFPLQIDVAAFGCANSNTQLSVSHNGKTLITQNIGINSNQYFKTLQVDLEAKESGTQHYTVNLSRLTNEATYVNNTFDVFVNVVNGKQKVLILANTPHPDLGAYEKAIAANENYEVKTHLVTQNQAQPDIAQYNLVLLHQLPGWKGEGLSLIRQIKEKQIPMLIVLGTQTGLNYLSQVDQTVSVSASRASVNDAQAVFNPNFSLFTLTDEEVAHIQKFPPLLSPFGNYRINTEADILLKQQIGYVKTDYPLIVFGKGAGSKAAWICGEGFWKWRLADYELSKQQTTQTLAGKMVQFLAAKKDQSLFRITSKKRFDENERIVMDAEVYNESYELINTPEVSITIESAGKRSFNYTFSKKGKAYTLDAGILAPGTYTYVAKATIGSKLVQQKGSFTVVPLQVEYIQTVADHQLLNELSSRTNGAMFYPNQLAELRNALQQNETIKPVIYKKEELKSWINLKWLFVFIVAMMSVEWFVRKWNGSI